MPLIEQFAVINERNGFFHPGQGIDVELEIFDSPQGIPFLDNVVLFAINHHIKSHAADQRAVDGISGLTHGISLAKKRLKIGANLDRRRSASHRRK